MIQTRQSEQCEFCIYRDQSFDQSGTRVVMVVGLDRVVQLVQVVQVVQVAQVIQVVQVVQLVTVAWVVRVVLVIKFVDAYGFHGLNNQIIEKT